MLMILFWVAVGIVIGWNLPQPAWAKDAQERVTHIFKGLSSK